MNNTVTRRVFEVSRHLEEGEDAVDVLRNTVVRPGGEVKLLNNMNLGISTSIIMLQSDLNLPDQQARVDLGLVRREERDIIKVEHLATGRPVLETFDTALLLTVCQHDDVPTLLLYHHPPEVQNCVLLGSLGNDDLIKNVHVVKI